MIEEVPDGNGFLSTLPELRQEPGDRIIETELLAFPQLDEADGGQRFARGQPEHNRLGRHGCAQARLAKGPVGNDLAE